MLFLLPFLSPGSGQLRSNCVLKTITTADRSYLQVQIRVLRMAAFVDYLQVRQMTGHDAHECIGFVMLTEVCTKTALTVLNRFHLVILDSCRFEQTLLQI